MSCTKPSSPPHPSDYPPVVRSISAPWCPLTCPLPAGSVWTGFCLPCPVSFVSKMRSLAFKRQALCSYCRLPLSRWQKGRDRMLRFHSALNSLPLWPTGDVMHKAETMLSETLADCLFPLLSSLFSTALKMSHTAVWKSEASVEKKKKTHVIFMSKVKKA